MSDQTTNTQTLDTSVEETVNKEMSQEEQKAPENGAESSKKASKDDGTKDEAKPAAKYTDDDLNNIIAKKKREWEAKAKEAADEAAKLAGMNAEEKAQHEREKAERRAEEAERELAKLKMTDTAKTMLAEANITSVGSTILDALIGPDAETTKANIDAFVSEYTAAVEAAVKERLRGTTPKTGASGAKKITREEIAAVKDPAERRRLIAENLDLYE